MNSEKSQNSANPRHLSSSRNNQLPSTITIGAVITTAFSTGSCFCRSYCGGAFPLSHLPQILCQFIDIKRFRRTFICPQIMGIQPGIVMMEAIHWQRLDLR